MKCISKKLLAGVSVIAVCLSLSGCSPVPTPTYDIYRTTDRFGLSVSAGQTSDAAPLFASELWVPLTEDSDASAVGNVSSCAAAGLFDVTDKKSVFGYHMLDQVYPASTTKILTALTAIKYGNLDTEVTVPHDAVNGLEEGSSVAGLREGDVITLRQLLYGLMLPSGNDAAIAIAYGVSGSVEDFVALMNQEAQSLGATHSHFVTTNGLHDEDHYTTAYDMSLIMHAAMQDPDFAQVAGSASYDASYRSADGSPVRLTWRSTTRYLDGRYKLPDGITLLGAKTGTTGEAKYCLACEFMTADGKTWISTVYGADIVYNLYSITSDLMTLALNGGAAG